MIKNENLFTATMAETFAEQGYVEYAKRIYKILLKKEPDNERIKKAYLKLVDQTKNSYSSPSEESILLFEEWLDLMLKVKLKNSLSKLKKEYEDIKLSKLLHG